MPSMRGFEMKVKKKNIIWLCANVAVFALFVFFFRVKFVAAAAENASLAYGLVAVLLSLAFGWGAGAIWRRF